MAQKKYISIEKLNLYDEKIKKVISDGDVAAEAAAKAYADSLATNYDAAGAAATVQGKLDEEVARAKAAEEANAAAAKQAQDEVDALEQVVDGKAAQDDLDKLEGYVGTIPEGYTEETVIAYINKKAEETLSSASGGSTESAASVLAALNTYKTENDPRVAANTTAAANAQSAAEAAQASANSAQEYAEGVESAHDARIKAIEDDYLKTSDKEELQGNIDTVSGAVERLTNGVSAEEVDGVNDLIQYVKDHGSEVTAMQEDIAKNTEAIEGVTGRMATAEDKITTVEGAVATKADQTALDEAVEALESADSAIAERIQALEGAVGESGSVAEDIANAKQEAIDTSAEDATTKANTAETNAKAYTDTEVGKDRARLDALEAASANHALASDVTALTGRVATAEGEIDTLQEEMDTVEAKAAANETAIGNLNTTVAGKAEQTALQSEIDRATDAETALGARIDEFVEASESEVLAMFA